MRLRGRVFTIIILGVLSLSTLAGCILVTVRVARRFNPKTSARWYREASIQEMAKGCRKDHYSQPESWMKPANGLDDVLELSYSRSLPIPDAFYSCSFYLQVQPASIEKGQELLIPGEEVQTFLIEMRAAFIFCTDKIMGNIQILEVYGESVKAWLEVSRTIQGAKWEYSGEVEFKRPSLPK